MLRTHALALGLIVACGGPANAAEGDCSFFNKLFLRHLCDMGPDLPRLPEEERASRPPPEQFTRPTPEQSRAAQEALDKLLRSSPPRPTGRPDPADPFGTNAYERARQEQQVRPPQPALDRGALPIVKPASNEPALHYEHYRLPQNSRGFETAARLMPKPAIPATASTSPPSVKVFVPPQGHTFGEPGVRPVSLSTVTSQPGGIKLARAAAERLALDLDLEGVYHERGMIVLAGRRAETNIDAALFLTSLRLACLSHDPYFSLDPPDPAAWHDQTERAMETVWNHIKHRYSGPGGQAGVHTVSARRDLPAYWNAVAPRFPALKSQLVFEPEWLRHTRFGEILYKADILLKELSVGDSVVQPEQPFRGAMIPGYMSASRHSVERGLRQEAGWGGRSGNRLWFDLLPKGDRAGEIVNVALFATERTTDLSAIHPQMFVRRHEQGSDLPGSNPSLDKLSSDVNSRTSLYSSAYSELRDLTGIFRAYVAAVSVAQKSERVCAAVRALPMSSGERVAQTLPEYHPAELFISIAKRSSARSWHVVTHSSVNGGVAVRGKALYSTATVAKPTPLIAEMERAVAAGIHEPKWNKDGRQFVALTIDAAELPKVPIAARP